MQINSISKHNNTNFKAINLVQIPRKAFENPENYKECSRIFSKNVDRISKEFFGAKLSVLLAFISTKFVKNLTVLESFSLSGAREALNDNKINYSLSWLKQNTGLEIPDALDNEYHSFYIYTKEDKSKMMDAIKTSAKNLMTYAREAISKYDDPKMQNAYTAIKMAIEIDSLANTAMAGTSIKKFKIENLDELKSISKELDF